MPDFQPIPTATFQLLPEKALFWKERKTLMVSDLHIGKGGHFRRHGIALPVETNVENLWRLSGLLLDHKPDRLLLLGDLFHSDYNHEWDSFCDMLANFPGMKVDLVLGNHDILKDIHYSGTAIERIERLAEDGFLFTHEPIDQPKSEEGYNISGHLHPAVILRGKGRQSLRLPCFWFGEKQAVLPAFGTFTGMHVIRPHKKDRLFTVTPESVIAI